MLKPRVSIVFGTLLVAFFAGFGWMAWKGMSGEPREAPQEPAEQISRVQPGAEWVRIYLDEEARPHTVVGSVPPEWIGLTAAEVAALLSEWRLLGFSSERIVAEIQCREYAAGGFIRLEGGRLAIYEGDPHACHRLREMRSLDVTVLTPFQRDELSAGIPFRSDEELELILDGVYGP